MRTNLTGVAATNLASLENIVMAQAPGLISDLCPKAQALYGQGIRMGLLFAQGGVRMQKIGILMVKTLGYAGPLRRMAMDDEGLWLFEGEGASDQEDHESICSGEDFAEPLPIDEVAPTPPVVADEVPMVQPLLPVAGLLARFSQWYLGTVRFYPCLLCPV